MLPFRDEFAAIDPDRFPIEYIEGRVASGDWRVWSTDRAAIIAEIKIYPTGEKEVHGIAAAGELAEIVALIPHAEQWGRDEGCSRAVIESRPGWARLPGYVLHQVSVRKDL
jgi:hypothetical protein